LAAEEAHLEVVLRVAPLRQTRFERMCGLDGLAEGVGSVTSRGACGRFGGGCAEGEVRAEGVVDAGR
jgi:hypothetical protein